MQHIENSEAVIVLKKKSSVEKFIVRDSVSQNPCELCMLDFC